MKATRDQILKITTSLSNSVEALLVKKGFLFDQAKVINKTIIDKAADKIIEEFFHAGLP